jgi:hypothetical protein
MNLNEKDHMRDPDTEYNETEMNLIVITYEDVDLV